MVAAKFAQGEKETTSILFKQSFIREIQIHISMALMT